MGDLSLEDLSTAAPFRDPEWIDLRNVDGLLVAIRRYAKAEPRILALSAPNHRVLFGVGAPFSFVDAFDWRTGRALSAWPEAKHQGAVATRFLGRGETCVVQPDWLLLLSEVLGLVEWLARLDERPGWVQWRLSP